MFFRPKQGLVIQSGLTRFRLAPNSDDLVLMLFSEKLDLLTTMMNTSPRPEYVKMASGNYKLTALLRKGEEELARETIDIVIADGQRVHLKFRPCQGRVISARNPQFYVEVS